MESFERLRKSMTSLERRVIKDVGPDLPLMAYDENFAENGRLMLPFDNRSGWASCIIPSQTHPSAYIVGLYETLKVISPPPSYLARLIKINQSGEVDPEFANGEGFMNVNFAAHGISIIRGIHETSDGFFIWGDNTSLSGGSFVTRPYLCKKRANGSPDPNFGENGTLDINKLGLDYTVQLVSGQSCTLLADGGVFIGAIRVDTDISLIIKLDATGKLDRNFQNNGTLVIKNDSKSTYLHGLTGTDQEGLLVFGATFSDSTFAGVVMKYDRAGNKSSLFGKGGSSELTVKGYNPIIAGVQTLADKRLLLTGFADTERNGVVVESLIGVLDADGKPDKSFNGGQIAFHQFDADSDLDRWHMATPQLASQGKILAVGAGGTSGSNGPVVGRFNNDGSADKTFLDGYAFGTLNDASFSPNQNAAFVHPTSGQILVAGSVNNRPAILALEV